MSRCRNAALALALLAWAGLSAGQGGVQTGAAKGAVGKGGSNLPNIAPNIPPNIAQSSARYPGIGRSATANEIAAWDIDVRPDFKGLPAGSGSVAKGQEVWEGKCASCHGVFGEATNVYNRAGGRHHDGRHPDRQGGPPARPGVSRAHHVDEGVKPVDAVGLHQPPRSNLAGRAFGVRFPCQLRL